MSIDAARMLLSTQETLTRQIWTMQSTCIDCRLQAAYAQPGRSSLATANLVLDAHRQVFEAFIHSFTTYRPLLLKIRGAYEEALQDALNSQADNIHMKAQLAALHQRKAGPGLAGSKLDMFTLPWILS